MADLQERIVQLLRAVAKHNDCEDGFYACPKAEGYFGSYERLPMSQRPCECWGDDAAQLLIDMGRQ